jgi:hypothetical protein
MLPEDVWLVLAIGIVLGVVGWPIYRLAHRRSWRRSDPLAEAQERLRIAKLDAETVRLNREAERVYDDMYKEALEEQPPPPDEKKQGE